MGVFEWLSASGPGPQAMAALLEDWGVPERAIVLESESRNTYENATNMENKFDRITLDPAVMNGQPCIRGMRLTVRRVVEAVALYPNRQELKAEYPELEDDDIRQALEFAAHNLDDEIISLGAA
jgi:uncharacterized protein (DUF433 family)